MSIGISNSGNSSEDLYRQATGAVKTGKAAIGDALLTGHAVEVKAVGSSTLNQVRAVKYIPLVAHDTKNNEWYVVPPQAVVHLVSLKVRGQHTENPFESATLNLKDLAQYKIGSVSDLAKATLDAVQSGQTFPAVQASMAKVLQDSQLLAQRSLAEVKSLLKSVGLTS
jgi:hypothetical protein